MSDTIAELMSRDPSLLTKDDMRPIVEVYRKARGTFNLGGKGAKAAGKTSKVAGAKIEKASLDDLGL